MSLKSFHFSWCEFWSHWDFVHCLRAILCFSSSGFSYKGTRFVKSCDLETQRCPVGDVMVSQSFVDFCFELLEFGITAVTVVLEPAVSVFGHDGESGEEILIVSGWELEDASGRHTCFIVWSVEWTAVHRKVIPHQLTKIHKFSHLMSSRFMLKHFSDVKVKKTSGDVNFEIDRFFFLVNNKRLPVINLVRIFE